MDKLIIGFVFLFKFFIIFSNSEMVLVVKGELPDIGNGAIGMMLSCIVINYQKKKEYLNIMI